MIILLDNPAFFVGGPVWAMAWLPIPSVLALSENVKQFIAISTHSTMDAEYFCRKSYSGKNLIQIWEVGVLNHKTRYFSDLFFPHIEFPILAFLEV